MSVIDSLAAAMEPWNALYSKSKAISGSITFLHVGSLVVGGGLAIASDRAALRARRLGHDEQLRVLRDFSAVHAPVLTALGVIVASGAAMALADVNTFLVSPLYYTKMGVFLLLLGNGAVLKRTEERLAATPAATNPLWKRLTASSVVSITLWLTITLLGVFLVGS